MRPVVIFAALICVPALASAQEVCTSAPHRALDFWVGTWALDYLAPDSTIRTAHNRITKEFNGCLIVERFMLTDSAGKPAGFTGTSYSAFDPQLNAWRQMWVDDSGGVFYLTGGPASGPHRFEFVTREPVGTPKVIMRMIWEDVHDDRLVWRWQSQTADGWQDRWVLNYRRIKGN